MIIPILLLVSLGIVVIYTSNPVLAIQQLTYALVGTVCYFAISNFDFNIIKSFNKIFYFILLFLLLVVFILGIETRGSLRWIPLGPFNLQPSEFAKIALILALSSFWSNNLPSWKNIAKSFLILVPFAVLIFRQPDLGTTLTLVFSYLIILIFANISLIKIFIISLFSLISLPLGWFFLKDYQKQRIVSFFFPTQDPLGVGYNVIQSTIAVGSGQILGRGLGRGTQSRLQFLPEFRTDFIFAFIAEELGLFGSLIILCLYLVIFYLCARILFRAKDLFGQLLIVGVMGMLFFQILVNIGMNTGLLPITGITLPLLSYGGSSMLTVFISLGLVESVRKYGLKRQSITAFGYV